MQGNLVTETKAQKRNERLFDEKHEMQHRKQRQDETRAKMQEHRKKLLEAVSTDAYNGVDLFEGTTPLNNTGAPGQAHKQSVLGDDPNGQLSGSARALSGFNWFSSLQTLEGYLTILDPRNGNIVRMTNIINKIKKYKKDNIKPIGFIVSQDKVYLSLSNGRLIIIETLTGKPIDIKKIDNEKISRPYVLNNDMYIIKDNAILKLN